MFPEPTVPAEVSKAHLLILSAMPVTIVISAALRAYCREVTAEVHCSAKTVRAALEQLERTHPLVYQGACDETGAVRRHVHLFVNDTLIHREGLDTALAPGDILSIMPAVSGG
jgi:molybdopterin converting factor small subunit